MTADVTTSDWVQRTDRLYLRVTGLLEDLDESSSEERVLLAAETSAPLVKCNRVFQSLTDHVEPAAADRSVAWRQPTVSVMLPVEQRGVTRVAVPTGEGETAVVPVGTNAGGMAWTEETLSLEKLNRWRDRTIGRRSEDPNRSRGTHREAMQVFLPPNVLHAAMDQLRTVLSDLEDAYDISFALDEDAD